jgi:hypothetical protein
LPRHCGTGHGANKPMANVFSFMRSYFPRGMNPAPLIRRRDAGLPRAVLQPVGLHDFLNLSIAPREMLLSPILPARSLSISLGLHAEIPNDGFRVLAADQTENGINLGCVEGQKALEPLLDGVDLLVLDNLSTLCTTGSESASDAWVPMRNWLLKLRRQGVAVLLIHHAGTNGRQRGYVSPRRRAGYRYLSATTRG